MLLLNRPHVVNVGALANMQGYNQLINQSLELSYDSRSVILKVSIYVLSSTVKINKL